jgi:hypothetical protein
MVAIKTDHEAGFSGPPAMSEEALERAVQGIIAASIEDGTDRVVLRPPQTLARFSTVLALDESPEERQGTIEFVLPTLEALRIVPVDTRAVFAILVDRTRPGDSVSLPIHEIELTTGRTPEEIAPHVEMLERYRLAGLAESWRDDRPVHWILSACDVDGWDFWSSFRTYCDKQNLRVKEIINELRFDSLD